ncbi:MAG TPA: V-type proton ATPase subunit E [Dictyoglomaceae bacterium]|nr:V-type proton ATPase subunit E [Dictyoglomaceae bacterium]HOL39145.1 V-type proton ATPase subunit E [Dictyoglomaceae bacterium]HOP94246.1 V-type proton ATPase subunit E [Dictyoglomaceae bacterium]HPP15299.1 V-type proton ATPase subunit E [Dictyoglomaceae bacterium]HPU42705.1 V-type proton ATPase subunit E [Dictyoglomaceae bacterium]
MSLDNVLERLEKEKQSQIQEIKDKKEKEFLNFATEKEAEIQKWKDEQRMKLEEKIKSEESALLSKKRLGYKVKVAGLEVEIVNNLKKEVLSKIKELSQEEYQKMWERIIERDSLRDARIYLSKEENKLDVKRLKQKYNLEVMNERVEGAGGFILEKGDFVVDLTLEVILEEFFDRYLLDIAKILRGEE